MTDSKKNISIIYYQKNDSPKYLEINKKRFILFLVGLPAVALLAVMLAFLGLLQSSPFHTFDLFKQNTKARVAINANLDLVNKLNTLTKSNKLLTSELEKLQQNIPLTSVPAAPTIGAMKCPQIATPAAVTAGPIGLASLAFFKPVHGQVDKTHPASLNLTGFRVTSTKDSANLQFNIINLLGDNIKLAGHIIVVMKNETAIKVYPQAALNTNEFQISYNAGEPFATQRFRPVDASFSQIKKPGNYSFTVFIFSRTGDLLHFQNIVLPVH